MPSLVHHTSDSGIHTLTIDREDKRNALNREALAELEAQLKKAAADESVRVVVLRGRGEEAFCAGADLAEVRENEGLTETKDYFAAVTRVIRAMHEIEAPVIARVQGYALAGGCGLAVAADFTIAGESAIFGLPEIGVGLLPMVVSAPIFRATGSRKTVLDLVLSGRRVDASEAQSLGLVTRVVPDAELDEVVGQLSSQLAKASPAALRLGKRGVYTLCEMDYESALQYLQEMITLTALGDDAQEGIQAFFEKRSPRWKAR